MKFLFTSPVVRYLFFRIMRLDFRLNLNVLFFVLGEYHRPSKITTTLSIVQWVVSINSPKHRNLVGDPLFISSQNAAGFHFPPNIHKTIRRGCHETYRRQRGRCDQLNWQSCWRGWLRRGPRLGHPSHQHPYHAWLPLTLTHLSLVHFTWVRHCTTLGCDLAFVTVKLHVWVLS